MKTIEQLTAKLNAWYSSNDEEVWHGGPYASEEEAEAGAKSEEHRLIAKATKGYIRLSEHFHVANFLMETEEHRLCDMASEDGDPILDFTTEQQADLQVRIRTAIDEWQVAHQLTITPWVFSGCDEPKAAIWTTEEPADES